MKYREKMNITTLIWLLNSTQTTKKPNIPHTSQDIPTSKLENNKWVVFTYTGKETRYVYNQVVQEYKYKTTTLKNTYFPSKI
jgi:hypothetical protein